jgi:hypothetical protein
MVINYIVKYNSTQRVKRSYLHCNVQEYTESGEFYIHIIVQKYTESGGILFTM